MSIFASNVCLSCFVASLTAAYAAPRIDSISPDTVFYGKGGTVTVTVRDAKPGTRLMVAPGGPTPLAGVDLPAAARDIAVGDGVAVIAAGTAGALVIDLAELKIIGKYDDGSNYTHVALRGDQALVSTDNGRLVQIAVHDHKPPRLEKEIQLQRQRRRRPAHRYNTGL